MVQTPSEGARPPIENSPPGIHTMPAGAVVGAGIGLGIVGAKAGAAGLAGSSCAAAGCVPAHHTLSAATSATARQEVGAALVAAPPRWVWLDGEFMVSRPKWPRPRWRASP